MFIITIKKPNRPIIAYHNTHLSIRLHYTISDWHIHVDTLIVEHESIEPSSLISNIWTCIFQLITNTASHALLTIDSRSAIISLVPGKIFENFTLNPAKMDTGSPPSQPPTPPSTPLSPKSGVDTAAKYTSTSIPNIPNLVITHNSSPNIPQNFATTQQKTPLNLGVKPKTTYTNGGEFNFGEKGDEKVGGEVKGTQASRVSVREFFY